MTTSAATDTSARAEPGGHRCGCGGNCGGGVPDAAPERLRGVLTEHVDGALDWTYLQSGSALRRVQVGRGAH